MRAFHDFIYAPVAQLDRVLVSEAKGHRFDSCRAHHTLKSLSIRVLAVITMTTEEMNLGTLNF